MDLVIPSIISYFTHSIKQAGLLTGTQRQTAVLNGRQWNWPVERAYRWEPLPTTGFRHLPLGTAELRKPQLAFAGSQWYWPVAIGATGGNRCVPLGTVVHHWEPMSTADMVHNRRKNLLVYVKTKDSKIVIFFPRVT